MTERIFDLDSSITSVKCKVVDLYRKDNKLYVETDRTVFFPQGGGQTSDRGYLGEAYVENVQDLDGKIVHIVENYVENVEKFEIGAEIIAKIDENKRFSDMQQHSGEHIFSGVVHKLFGYDNVGFHLGSDFVTIDISGELSADDICKAEYLVNQAIWKNLEIKVSYPEKDELERMNYRSKKEIQGAVRIVEIPGIDVCACCAPHVKRTGEIGMFRVVKSEKHNGGTRLFVLCGERAYLDSREKLHENHIVSTLFSCPEKETAANAEKLKADLAELTYKLANAKKALCIESARSIEKADRIVYSFEENDTNTARELADLLSLKAADFAAVLFGEEKNKFVMISKSDFDLNTLCREFCKKFDGRGGGRNGIVQGSFGKNEEVEAFLKEFQA